MRSESKKNSQVRNIYIMLENFVIYLATTETESLEKRTLDNWLYAHPNN